MKINWNEINDFFKGIFSIFLGFSFSLITLISYDNIAINNVYLLIFIYILTFIFLSFILKIFLQKFLDKYFFLGAFLIVASHALYTEFTKNSQPINEKVTIQQKSAFQTEEQKYKYNYGTIEEKIIILKNMGLSKQQVYNKLENNTEFRTLIKDNQNKFDEIFQKEN